MTQTTKVTKVRLAETQPPTLTAVRSQSVVAALASSFAQLQAQNDRLAESLHATAQGGER